MWAPFSSGHTRGEESVGFCVDDNVTVMHLRPSARTSPRYAPACQGQLDNLSQSFAPTSICSPFSKGVCEPLPPKPRHQKLLLNPSTKSHPHTPNKTTVSIPLYLFLPLHVCLSALTLCVFTFLTQPFALPSYIFPRSLNLSFARLTFFVHSCLGNAPQNDTNNTSSRAHTLRGPANSISIVENRND